jgi:hypothetical protein
MTSLDSDPIYAAITAHREACAIRDMACAAYDNAPEDEECSATQMAVDYMSRTVDVEQGVLADLMSTIPTSVAELAALILHVDAYNREQDAFGNDTLGRAEALIARLSSSIRLVRVA